MRDNIQLKFAGVLVALFAGGIALGLGYEWYRGLIIPAQLFVTAAGNVSPSEREPPVANQSPPGYPAAGIVLPAPNAKPAMPSNAQAIQPSKPVSQTNSNVVVLNPANPPARPMPNGGNELMLPQSQPNEQSADRLPVIGSEGQTILVPRAIEGCWAGSGDSRLQYLGGCPNMFSGGASPVKLRWCFRRMGDQPLTLLMAKGQYRGQVSQHWDVMGARGQTIELREKISYKTMMFLQVVDVGDWSCRITPADELVCEEHELARCGPGKWMQGPWFRGSGWVTARRVGAANAGRHVASEP